MLFFVKLFMFGIKPFSKVLYINEGKCDMEKDYFYLKPHFLNLFNLYNFCRVSEEFNVIKVKAIMLFTFTKVICVLINYG